MSPQRAILELLQTGERLRGLELVQLNEGVLRRSTVYVYLGQLEESGFVRSFESGKEPYGELTICAYEITDVGRAALLRDDI